MLPVEPEASIVPPYLKVAPAFTLNELVTPASEMVNPLPN